MRWYDAMTAVVSRLQNDAALVAVLGSSDRIYHRAARREKVVPSVVWFSYSDVEFEVMNPIEVQFDLWAKATNTRTVGHNMAIMEHAVRRRLHQDAWVQFDNVNMSSMLLTARDVFDQGDNEMHRQLDFRFTPLRARYVPTPV